MQSNADKTPKWNYFDVSWILSLFGTAVGAGILYLPIRAGGGGFYPVVVMCVLIFPMVFLSHRALARFVAQADGADKDITHAAEEYFGLGVGFFITILYFFAIFPICLAYCVGITNTFASFGYYQLLPLLDSQSALKAFLESAYQIQDSQNGAIATLLPIYRAVLVFVLVSAFMGIMLFKQRLILKVCEWLVYPLCAVLFAFSLYLIPHWNLASLSQVPSINDFLIVVWLTLPVLVFAFNHSPAISTYALSIKHTYPQDYETKSNRILFATSSMLLFFVMFFVFSCVLSLSPDELSQARAQNIPVLSYFANKLGNPIISYGGPLVAFLAITSSFFGHYFGAREGAEGIVRKCTKMAGFTPNLRAISVVCGIAMYVIMLLVAYYNPSVLDFIENLGGPIIAAILFLMPIIAIWSVSKLKKFKNPALDIFVFLTGLLSIFSLVYKFFV